MSFLSHPNKKINVPIRTAPNIPTECKKGGIIRKVNRQNERDKREIRDRSEKERETERETETKTERETETERVGERQREK